MQIRLELNVQIYLTTDPFLGLAEKALQIEIHCTTQLFHHFSKDIAFIQHDFNLYIKV